MTDQLPYVRGKLDEARKVRGQIAKIARAVQIDQRTVRSVLNPEHSPNVGTLAALAKYFKRIDRGAQQ
jgi:hypothetical protein